MTSNMLQLDCTVQMRTCEVVGTSTQRIRGVISDPYGCDQPVYYCALYKWTGENQILVEGVAGFDSEYEKGNFTWLISQSDM